MKIYVDEFFSSVFSHVYVFNQVKILEFATSLGSDKAAHNEPPQLDLNCLPPVFEFSI